MDVFRSTCPCPPGGAVHRTGRTAYAAGCNNAAPNAACCSLLHFSPTVTPQVPVIFLEQKNPTTIVPIVFYLTLVGLERKLFLPLI